MSDSTTYNLLTGTMDGSWSKSVTAGEGAFALSADTYDGMPVVEHDIPKKNGKQIQAARFRLPVMPKAGESIIVSYPVRVKGAERAYVYTYSQRELSGGGNAKKTVNGKSDNGIGNSVTTATPEWSNFVTTYTYASNCTDYPTIVIGRAYKIDSDATLQVGRPMVCMGTSPAAWAPAEGEELAGGGAQMSANLLNGITPKLLNGATYDGTAWLTPARTNTENTPTYYLEWPLSQERLTTNQTYRVAMGTMGDGGSGYLTAYLAYRDAAGNSNAVAAAMAYGTSWARSEATMVVPSGMTPYLLSICKWGKHPAVSVAGPVLNMGARGIPIAITSATLAWSAGILATIRYYQLASPTSATPAVPSSSSSLGSWSETEPEADITKVLWTCERTVYADGTESWSKASKSTSYEAAKDAKSTATDAQSKAQDAQEQVLDVSARLDTNTKDVTATIESKVALVQQDVDSNTNDVSELNKRLTSEIKTRRSFMRFGEESSDPTLTLGQTDSPAQVKLTNKQLQFLYLNTVVAYMSGDALLINNAQILQQLMLGGFAVVPRSNGNLSLKWVG